MQRHTYISNNILSLVEYWKCDDNALYEDWLDPDTQKGYNGIYFTSFEDFSNRDIKLRFSAMIELNDTKEIVGAVAISPPETIADLSIQIFSPYRNRGYGTSAFALATKYAFETLNIAEIYAGAFPDNIASQKMLKKCGYVRHPNGDIFGQHYLTGEEIIQMDYIYRPTIIRLAVPSDALDMAQVLMRSWEVAYKDIIPADFIREKNVTRPEKFKKIITDGNSNAYVVQRDDKTVGIMHVAPPADDDAEDCWYELHYIYLHPDYYRQGVGSSMMDFAFDAARNLGKTVMIVKVLVENTNAIKFYEKCGFIADGKINEVSYGKTLKSIRMRRNLADDSKS